jgi:hypothetical protein
MKPPKKVKFNKSSKKGKGNLVPQSKGAVKNEVKRVLNTNMDNKVKKIMRVNMEKNDMGTSHIPFVSRFLRNLLQEADEVATPAAATPAPEGSNQKNPSEFTPEGDKQAFDQSMQPDTDPKEFDTQGVNPQVTSDTINSIKEWSTKLDEFAGFLNDPSTESLHKILSDGDRAGSLLRGVTRKASDSITRIAGEVEKLKEILNTYIITAPKKLRDTEQQVSGWTQY